MRLAIPTEVMETDSTIECPDHGEQNALAMFESINFKQRVMTLRFLCPICEAYQLVSMNLAEFEKKVIINQQNEN